MIRRIFLTLASLALAAALSFAPARAAEAPTLKIALLKFGTVNWLIDAVVAGGLDKAEGYRLEATPLAGKAATTIAFRAGDADLFVTDWFWVMLQRQEGRDYRFFPYSKSLGALITNPGGEVRAVCDLKGKKIGVVGGALDKSWLALQAFAAQKCGFALAEEAEALYGAPPLLSRQLEEGAVDATLTFWHYAARLEAAGKRRVLGVAEALDGLGVADAPALVGFVFDGARTDEKLIAAFRRSLGAAKKKLLESDSEWERLRPLMRVKHDAEFAALRDRYRQGLVAGWTEEDTAAAEKLHMLVRRLGGPALESKTGRFDADAFASAGAEAGR